MRLSSLVATFAALTLLTPLAAAAGEPEVGVVVPVREGQARTPHPVVIVPLGDKEPQPLPAPILVPDAATPGTTTVRPEFGGGYSVESPGGRKTTVRRQFGGGYTIQENGRTTTVVTPQFGGGYTVETTPESPPLVLPPPQQK